jgi:hypothetical protein
MSNAGQGRGKGHRLATTIARDNPHARIVQGTRHYKVLVSGKLVGILPRNPQKEGLSCNLVSQLRRAGLAVND